MGTQVTCPNRNSLRPYFVSMIMYLDSDWPLHFDSETLFLDQSTGTGVFVRPQPYRVVLMDQVCMNSILLESYTGPLRLVFDFLSHNGAQNALQICL